MLPADIETDDALRHLSVVDDTFGPIGRRRLLQGLGAGLGGVALASLLPGPLGASLAAAAEVEAAAASSDGILVVVTLNGGNDGLNTVVPYTSGPYRDLRSSLALGADRVLRLDGAVGLHPNLTFLAQELAAGRLAVVEGLGYPAPDLSHFSSMGIWMQGWGGTGTAGSGWLGRYLDGLDGGLLRAMVIGGTIPLAYVGRNRRATAISPNAGDLAVQDSPVRARVQDAIRALAATPTGRGAWADALARIDVDLLDVGRTVAPSFRPALPADRVERDFVLAGRLLNAGLGIRVLGVSMGDFDSHAGQPAMHDTRMRQLDAGLRSFFATLTPAVAARVTVMTVSEFGRTPRANTSQGTDHGTASCAFVLGASVTGGRYGSPPSLTTLNRGQLVHTVDFRSLYATVLAGVLGADADAVLGRRYEPLTGLLVTRTNQRAEPAQPVVVERPRTAGFVPISPERRLDTRDGTGDVPVAPIGPGATVELVVAGRGSVPPTGATAVALNVTVTGPSAAGYLTVWPTGEARPTASSLNFVPGQTVPNHVVAKLGAGGALSFFNSAGATHVVADVVGYFADDVAIGLVPLTPNRLLDTRDSASPIGPQATVQLPVTGRGGVPAEGVAAVVLNLTVTEPTAPGFFTVWPSGTPRPLASSLNFVAGETVPNLVVAKVGADGAVSIFNSNGRAHVVADVVGFYGPREQRADAVRAVALSPARVLDTRSTAPIGPGATLRLPMLERGGVPASGVRGVSLNVTVTEPTAGGYLTVWPSGTARPLASNLNFRPGQTTPNHVVAKLGPDGAVSIFNSAGTTHVVVDVVGFFAADAA
ncbi:MAG: DUF1501 domain-containing protein [Acidimicrobiales bacterium]